MSASAPITITPILDLRVEGERMPLYAHVVDHPEGRIRRRLEALRSRRP